MVMARRATSRSVSVGLSMLGFSLEIGWPLVGQFGVHVERGAVGQCEFAVVGVADFVCVVQYRGQAWSEFGGERPRDSVVVAFRVANEQNLFAELEALVFGGELGHVFLLFGRWWSWSGRF